MTLSTRIQSHLNTNSINNHFIENKPNLKSEKNRELFEKKLSKINSACLHTNKIHYAKVDPFYLEHVQKLLSF